jgi:methenyltetrahydromethanopterin cyclohydrolase
VNIPEYIIIAAGSGRMLAQAARRSGLKPLVIDFFADRDMQDTAEDFRQIPSLAIEHLAPAVDYYVKRYKAADVIYGSGFEYHPESLSYLLGRLNILGNSPDTFNKVLNKQAFYSVLDQLEIAYPEVRFNTPAQEDGWLVKPMQGQGGLGIKRYRQNDADYSSVYWQKFQQGSLHSVLFLADGQSIQVIGFNTQWTATVKKSETFAFSGVMNCTDLPDERKRAIIDGLTKLVPLLKLKGLNSLDFIQRGDKSYVLEINPRPSASMQLYKGDLLTAHIQASRGLFVDGLPSQNGCTAYQIVYATQDVLIPERFEWPDGCRDLPLFGAIINAGQPICSMIAHQNNTQDVLKQLLSTQSDIFNKLERFQTHAIYR